MDYYSKICDAMDRLADGNNGDAYKLLDRCISQLKTSSMQGEESAEEYYFWGICLNLMEEPEQALLKFEKSIQLEPGHEKSLWQTVSILFYHQQSAEPALSILENKLLKINPQNAAYLETQGDIKSYLKHLPAESD